MLELIRVGDHHCKARFLSHLKPDVLRPGATLDDVRNGLAVNGDFAFPHDGQLGVGCLNHVSSLTIQGLGVHRQVSKRGPYVAVY